MKLCGNHVTNLDLLWLIEFIFSTELKNSIVSYMLHFVKSFFDKGFIIFFL